MKLSLCMIVKNEELVIKRLLDNVIDIFDEIIIVDTGSTDNTINIISKYNISLYHYKWNNNFSDARNYSFSLATSDYIMWLDADDYISENNKKSLKEFKNKLDGNVDVVMMKYVSAFDSNNNPSFFFYRERIIKNKKDFKWTGEVHETISCYGNIIYSDIMIYHKKEKEIDKLRNKRIYEDKINNNLPLTTRDKYYYAKELFYNLEYDESIKYFNYFLDSNNRLNENIIDSYYHLGLIYEKKKEYTLALKALYESFNYSLPKANISCLIAYIYYILEDYTKSIYYYLLALNDKLEPNSFEFINKSFYDLIPMLALCHIYYKLNDYENSYKYHNILINLYPDNETIKNNDMFFNKQ